MEEKPLGRDWSLHLVITCTAVWSRKALFSVYVVHVVFVCVVCNIIIIISITHTSPSIYVKFVCVWMCECVIFSDKNIIIRPRALYYVLSYTYIKFITNGKVTFLCILESNRVSSSSVFLRNSRGHCVRISHDHPQTPLCTGIPV